MGEARSKDARLVVTGGGTGGHVYPAMAIAAEFRRRHMDAGILYIGSRRGLETRLVPQTGFDFASLSVGGIVGKSLPFKIYGLLGTVRAIAVAGRILRRFKPDVVVGTGGYVSVPVVMAAQLMGIPTVLQEQNSVPGLANRLLSRRASLIFAPSEDALEGLSRNIQAKAVVVGNPVRKDFSLVDRDIARRDYGIGDGEKLVVVTSGSGGAQTINDAVSDWIDSMEPVPEGLHILFATGKKYHRSVTERITRVPPRVRVIEYLDDAPGAFTAADLLICRAGAMTLAEATVVGAPMIVVPSPNVAHDHQRANARALEAAGAAVMVEDAECSGEAIGRIAGELIGSPRRLEQMSRASRGLGDPEALDRMLGLIEELMGVAGGDGD